MAKRGVGLINIGTCNIHIVNNAFLKGIDVFGNEVVELVIAIKYFFKDRPSRLSDYGSCQKKLNIPNHHFIKHVATRWLTLEPAANRIIEQWPAIIEYFLKFIPKKCAHLEKTIAYKTIKQLINNKSMLAQVIFITHSAQMFVKFTKLFQSNYPLIHLIYDETKHLLLNIALKIYKPDIVKSLEDDLYSPSTCNNINDLIPLKNASEILGRELINKLKELKVQEAEILNFTNKVRKHYMAAFEHILKKIPIFDQSNILKKLKCVQPHLIKSINCNTIIEIAQMLPNFSGLNELEMEWKMLQLENLDNIINCEERIDYSWRKIIQIKVGQNLKYPNLKKIIQSILCLSHGNADVERGFSTSARILTKDRSSMSEKTLNSVLLVADAIKCCYNNKPESIEITPELYKLAKNAHSSYELYLEENKRQQKLADEAKIENERKLEREREELQDKEKEKQRIGELENELATIQKSENTKEQAATELLEEAQLKLETALEKNNLLQANIAHGLIKGALSLREEQNQLHLQADKIQKNVKKRKSDLLCYFSKKSKLEIV